MLNGVGFSICEHFCTLVREATQFEKKTVWAIKNNKFRITLQLLIHNTL